MTIEQVRRGQRVRVIQEIDRREGIWRAEAVGVVQAVGLEKTGSWYAHSKDDKLWLLRIRLRKDDGELTTVTVDPLTKVELLEEAPAAP